MSISNDREKIFKISIFLVSFVLLFSFGVNGVNAVNPSTDNSTIYVNNMGNDAWDGQSSVYNGTSGPKKTIKNATSTVANHGTIYISSGTYHESNITVYTNMTIIGENQQNTIIDALSKGNIFILPFIDGMSFNLVNLTLQNGNSVSNGGAINNKGFNSCLSFINDSFTNNTASVDGGAIYSHGGSLTVTNDTFMDNSAINNGGVVFIEYASLLIGTNNIFKNSTASYGGAIYNYFGTVNQTNDKFMNNLATNTGGAIYNCGSNTILTNDVFTNNSATIYGGVIYNTGSLTVTNDTFLNNRAPYGGVIFTSTGYLDIIKSTLTNNIAYEGGVIYNYGSNMNLTGNTITYNKASNKGSTIYNYQNPSRPVTNSVINFNKIFGNTITSEELYSTDNSLNANLNWWGSNADPSSYVNNNVNITSWLVLTINASRNNIPNNSNTIITADLLHSNNGTIIHGDIPDGMLVNFETNLGSIGNSSFIMDGIAQSKLTSGVKAGIATVSAKLDNQLIKIQVIIKDTIPPTASANIKGGLYNTNKVVKLSMSENGIIYYTLNSKTPTTASTKYTGPITIKSTSTLKFLAVDLAGNKSPVYTAKYTIDKTGPTVVSTTPKNNAKAVSLKSPITIKFNENIKTSTSWNKIYVKNLKTGKLMTITKTITGNTLNIKTHTKTAHTQYQIYIPTGAVKDTAGNKNNKYFLNFKTSKY